MSESKQVISAERVAEYGEVLTAEREVEAMLDLVSAEAARIDSRFLEPACGNGNFLTAILRRKLETVARLYKVKPSEYQEQSLFALACVYGIDILPDNAQAARDRLTEQMRDKYKTLYKTEPAEAYLKAARYILSKNIVCGDALNGVEKISFIQWSLIDGNFKREEYKFGHLTASCADLPLFGFADGDPEKPVYQAKSVKTYPLISVLKIGECDD
ncbi:MAG: SAM-dependent DNA methyltransferase [Alphaproteobacteria bacterium]|nr:SAM-dependent DNA methyltransferase [Alphaproteobacteria bacterium]